MSEYHFLLGFAPSSYGVLFLCMLYTSPVLLAASAAESSSIFFKSAAFTELEHMGHNGSSDFSKRLQWIGVYTQLGQHG